MDTDFEALLLLDAQIVNERWTQTESGYQRDILSYGQLYKATDWRLTLNGTNALPLSSIVYPGDFARRVASEYEFHHDLSEDFIFHLHVLSHPLRPSIFITDGVSIHQSHRVGTDSDNVSTVTDRSKWCLDTGNGLYDLLLGQGRQFDDTSLLGAGLKSPDLSSTPSSFAIRHLLSIVLASSAARAHAPVKMKKGHWSNRYYLMKLYRRFSARSF
jgi:hypothetical protein